MNVDGTSYDQGLYGSLCESMRKCIFKVLSVGPIPVHVAFIMDGNRRYAMKHRLSEGDGHKAGFMNLCHILRHCYDMGVKYVTVYAFSIDNFKRRPEEVQGLMELMVESITKLLEAESIVEKYGIRLYFIGNLKLLHKDVRETAEKAMKVTADNKRVVLLVCVAYTSWDEMANSMDKSCEEKLDEVRKGGGIQGNGEVIPRGVRVEDIERNMYMSVAPEPDVMIRTSGETRLSNFLLWQTGKTALHCPRALWPDLGLWDVVWGVVNYQRSYSYLRDQLHK
ncbi:hypothetical protein MLD38_028701 [Melastoma candidum]|uniref:Uncharacterized protein n=1 Tax=Melastoma candidum TaxID=119954 RepID=A0ACB9N2D1_9MYRT|nr:hypothetical protein MLD38_028701 [Melastoma candidum]